MAEGFTGHYQWAGTVAPAQFYCGLCDEWYECEGPLEQEYMDHWVEFHD